MNVLSLLSAFLLVAFVNLLGCPGPVEREDVDFEQVALPAGEVCPQGCWMDEGHPGLACGGCEDGWCHQPLSTWHFPYCTAPCQDDADCALLGDGWSCERRACVEGDRR